jgi:D-inositol-3-phosphate glycosyltransferase
LPDPVVFVNNYYAPPGSPSRNRVAIMLHNTIPNVMQEAAYNNVDSTGKTMIATSVYSAQQWSLYLDTPSSHIRVVPPFAAPIFGSVKRAETVPHPRIIFAGRLSPDKGIYVLLEALHQQALIGRGAGWEVSIVAAGIHVEAGRTLARMLRGYPYAKLIPAQKTVIGMARLLAANDILVMPSVYAEPFGMLSVEAQHAGCRVVASNSGGLSQTHCGLLTLVKPQSADALVGGIEQAIALGAPTELERETAKNFFTLKSSVDGLVKALQL